MMKYDVVVWLMVVMMFEEKIGQLNLLFVGEGLVMGVQVLIRLFEWLDSGQIGVIFGMKLLVMVCVMQECVLVGLCFGILLFFVEDVIYGYCMVFLLNIVLVCSWDMDLIYDIVVFVVVEVVVDGLYQVYVLMLDVSCDFCWGCVVEGLGEDLLLVLCIVDVVMCGFQGVGLGVFGSVVVCLKYFVVYGVL